MDMTDKVEWHEVHSNLVTLTAWMAEHGYSAEAIAYAVEKPWKYEDEFKAARQDEINEGVRDA
jgi:hypothetical protein